MVIALAALLLAQSSTEAANSRYTVEALMRDCSGEAFQKMACTSFVSGVLDGSLATTANEARKPVICLPEVYSNRSVREAALNWLRVHPQYNEMNAGSMVLIAMTKQFPCTTR